MSACTICSGDGVLRDAQGSPVEQCPCTMPLTLSEWVTERMKNCIKIALKMHGKEKIGWLQDAHYFSALSEIETALGRIYYLAGSRKTETEKEIYDIAKEALKTHVAQADEGTNDLKVEKLGNKFVITCNGKICSRPLSKRDAEELLLYSYIKKGKSTIHGS